MMQKKKPLSKGYRIQIFYIYISLLLPVEGEGALLFSIFGVFYLCPLLLWLPLLSK